MRASEGKQIQQVMALVSSLAVLTDHSSKQLSRAYRSKWAWQQGLSKTENNDVIYKGVWPG